MQSSCHVAKRLALSSTGKLCFDLMNVYSTPICTKQYKFEETMANEIRPCLHIEAIFYGKLQV